MGGLEVDGALTIALALYTNWDDTKTYLNSRVYKEAIGSSNFCTARPASQRKFPSVEVHYLTETREPRDLGASRILVSAFFVAEVWVRVQSAASAGLGSAKADAFGMEREIARMIV